MGLNNPGGIGNITVDTFNGDAVTVAFTLTATPGTLNNTYVFIDGVYQFKSTYSVSGTTLTFGTAPPTGTSNIQVLSVTTLSIGTPGDGTVTNAKISGPISVVNGGTGQTTAAAGFAANSVGSNGTTDATAGNVGEYVSSYLVLGSAIGLSAGVGTNITSISLTAGDWDIYGLGAFTGSSGNVTYFRSASSAVSATMPAEGTYASIPGTVALPSSNVQIALPTQRVKITVTTTYYLVCLTSFSGGTVSGFGFISARRVR